MFKKSYRNSPAFSRDDNTKAPDWFKDFANNLEKNSVQPKSNTYDQIADILGIKSRYSSVEEAVSDMRKRVGLDVLLAKASFESPKAFEVLPKTKIFVDNFIADRPGVAIEAVVHALEKFFGGQLGQEYLDDSLRAYINKKIMENEQFTDNSDSDDMHLGKVDTDITNADDLNSDVFQGCTPTKI